MNTTTSFIIAFLLIGFVVFGGAYLLGMQSRQRNQQEIRRQYEEGAKLYMQHPEYFSVYYTVSKDGTPIDTIVVYLK